MDSYEQSVLLQLNIWQHKMRAGPSIIDNLSKTIQDKINNVIPQKVHNAITLTIRKMIEAVLFGAKFTSVRPYQGISLMQRDSQMDNKLELYRKTATAEGAVTGAGGILLGLADFPLLIGIKIKFLYDVAAIYGKDLHNYKERLFLLYVFQLAFCSPRRRQQVFKIVENWDNYINTLPDSSEKFDWQTFQQEYRDYIDLAKMAQLIPFIGAAVGAIANYKLLNHLGETAKNAYRMRLLATQSPN